jgi:hypothetical protein
MAIYSIKNEENEEINRIIADAEFVEENYAGRYEILLPAESTEEQLLDILKTTERQWRDGELEATDQAAQTLDWPNRDNTLTYRTALRDWPSTDAFPNTRPALGG